MPQAHRASAPRGVAGAEDRGDVVLAGLLVKGQGPDERRITPAIVEAIEEGVRERRAHREPHPRGGRALEARDRRLRGQAAAVDREDPLRDRIADAMGHAR